jgi:translation initiation factor 4E
MSADESDLLCPPEKAPLCTPWSFWFDKKLQIEKPTALDYRNNMNLLGTFDTVEDFWRHFIHIQSGSNLPFHCNVYMFRNTDLPSWERWPDGGCWILKVKRKQGVLNKLWQDLVFACIGEEFQQYSVVGVMLASRKNVDMLSVWCVPASIHSRAYSFARFPISRGPLAA